jgi:hypothetical protein
VINNGYCVAVVLANAFALIVIVANIAVGAAARPLAHHVAEPAPVGQ